jgi:hypothetical protein
MNAYRYNEHDVGIAHNFVNNLVKKIYCVFYLNNTHDYFWNDYNMTLNSMFKIKKIKIKNNFN